MLKEGKEFSLFFWKALACQRDAIAIFAIFAIFAHFLNAQAPISIAFFIGMPSSLYVLSKLIREKASAQVFSVFNFRLFILLLLCLIFGPGQFLVSKLVKGVVSATNLEIIVPFDLNYHWQQHHQSNIHEISPLSSGH